MSGDHSAVSGDHGEFVQDLPESFVAPATEDGKSPPADVVSNPSLATTSATTEPSASEPGVPTSPVPTLDSVTLDPAPAPAVSVPDPATLDPAPAPAVSAAEPIADPTPASNSVSAPAAAPDPDPDLENLDPTEASAPIPVTDPTSCAPIPSGCEPLPDRSTEGPLEHLKATWPSTHMAVDKALFELTGEVMTRYDLDQDGLLNIDEVRSLFRNAAGLWSKDRRNAAGFDHKTFTALCSDPRGLSAADLFELLAHSDGALGSALDAAQHAAAAKQQQKECGIDIFASLPAPERLHLQDRCPGALGCALMARADGNARAGTGGAPSCQEGLGSRSELRKASPKLSVLSDILNLTRLLDAIRKRKQKDVAKLLNEQHALWSHPNPEVLDVELHCLLQTNTARFPLLFVAAFSGDIGVLHVVAEHIRMHGDLLGAIGHEVEGWSMAAIIGLPAKSSGKKDRHNVMLRFMDLGGLSVQHPHLLRRCLFQSGSIAPLERAIWKGMSASEVQDWCNLVALIVRHSGFPHEDPWESMAKLSAHLTFCEVLDEFLKACTNAGGRPRPGSPAFAGLYLGLLDDKVGHSSSLIALKAIVDAGLDLRSPLSSPTGGLMPLHAAARHDRPHIVMGLIALRADLVTKDSRGRTALDVARAGRSGQTVAVLRKAARTPLQWEAVVQSMRTDKDSLLAVDQDQSSVAQN